ncbi:MAG: transcriptional coactivator p15/PC4 family protein, partial [Petrotogaceae bacterium]|nr:transcriptional coactivator p15/PC4 family protein [Petrotogaceae bacterium]
MYEIQRNPTEKLIIQKNEFKGKEYIDIRIFYEDEGEYKPTKKGVTFNP